VYKRGPRDDKNSYRVIGKDSGEARLLQSVLYRHVLGLVLAADGKGTGSISPEQFGFLPRRGPDRASWLAASLAAVSQVLGSPVYTTFVDIVRAYGSTSHPAVLVALWEIGVRGRTWALLANWLGSLVYFVRVGAAVSPAIPVRRGVPEGAVTSPLLFEMMLDVVLVATRESALRHPSRGLPIVFPQVMAVAAAPNVLSGVWLADDGELNDRSRQAQQLALAVVADAADSLGLKLHVGVGKTMSMVSLPFSRAARSRARTRAKQDVPLMYGDTVVAQGTVYRHLGVYRHANGGRFSAAAHLAALVAKQASVYHQMAVSGIKSHPLFAVRAAHLTLWMPQLTYGLEQLFSTAPIQLVTFERRLLVAAIGAPWAGRHPACVLRSLLGIPSLQTRLDQARLSLLFRLLMSPAGGLLRLELAQEARVWSNCSRKLGSRLWWDGTVTLLQQLDSAGQRFPVRDAVTGVVAQCCWASSLSSAALDSDTDQHGPVVAAAHSVFKQALLALEGRRHAEEVASVGHSGKGTSLAEVADLLVTPNFAPFIIDKRSKATGWRVKLYAGRLGAFGYEVFHLPRCPWCGAPRAWHIPHLLRDCPAWEASRLAGWRRAQACAGVAVPLSQHTRQLWYRLTVGAAVPTGFLGLQLDEARHFARPEGTSMTAALRKQTVVYQQVLAVTGDFLVTVMEATLGRVKAALQPQVTAAVVTQQQSPKKRRRRRRQAVTGTTADGGYSGSGGDHSSDSDYVPAGGGRK